MKNSNKMRTVKTFSFGISPTSGGAQELVVVAKDKVFSHSHYFVRYPDGDHRDLLPDCYQSASDVAEEVRNMCRGNWVNAALAEVGCA